tara:strand:+ start:52 stop:975 length:924 start_codon:yes stop_codon:yes gene_type:complete
MNEAQEKIIEQENPEENVIVDIEDSTEKKDETSKEAVKEEERTEVQSEKPDEELDEYSENVQKRINQLTAKRKQALEEADAAYKYAEEQKKKNDELQKQLTQLNTGYTSEFGNRIEAQTAQAKKLYKEAFDAGDAEKMSEASDLMAKLAIENERLRIQKLRSEKTETTQKNEGSSESQERQAAQRQQIDPKLQAWLDKNTWFGRDMVMSRGAQAIHEQLVAVEGIDPTTDDYYKEIDKRMRVEFPQKFQVDRKNAQTVAPANGKAVTSGRKKQVELTPGQVAFAKKMRIPLEQYAKEVAKIETRKGA